LFVFNRILYHYVQCLSVLEEKINHSILFYSYTDPQPALTAATAPAGIKDDIAGAAAIHRFNANSLQRQPGPHASLLRNGRLYYADLRDTAQVGFAISHKKIPKNSEHFSLPRNGSERNSESFLFRERRNRRDSRFIPAEFRLFRGTENSRNSIPNHSVGEKNARSSVQWIKSRSKLSEFPSKPFRGREKCSEFRSKPFLAREKCSEFRSVEQNRSKISEFRSEAIDGF
jgi:hypothetical protein